MANICRHKSDSYPFEQVVLLFPVVNDLIRDFPDDHCLADLCQVLVYASDNDKRIVMSIINHHIHESIYGILRLCCDGNAEVVTHYLYVIDQMRHWRNSSSAQLFNTLRTTSSSGSTLYNI